MLGLQGRQAHSLPEKPDLVRPMLDLSNLQQLILLCLSSEMPSQSPPEMSTCPKRVSYPWLLSVTCETQCVYVAGSGGREGGLGNALGIR